MKKTPFTTVIKVALLATVLATAGCATPEQAPQKEHQVNVEFRDLVHVAPFVGLNHTLTREDSDRLELFLASFNPLAAQHVLLEGDGRQKGMNSHIAYVKKRLVNLGIPRGAIEVDNKKGSSRHEVTIVVNYALAVAPEHCPDWSALSQYNKANQLMSNHGCAFRNTMAQQISNPADLVKGNGSFGGSGERNSVAIGIYRANQSYPGFNEDTSSSAVSTTSTSQ